jgi:hypothetical protein
MTTFSQCFISQYEGNTAASNKRNWGPNTINLVNKSISILVKMYQQNLYKSYQILHNSWVQKNYEIVN